MLSTIRDKATGWIAGVIVGLLVISFAFWGVSFYSGQSGTINVALVNESEISFQSFQRSFAQLRKHAQSVLGDSLSLEEEALIKNQTIEKLIETSKSLPTRDVKSTTECIADENNMKKTFDTVAIHSTVSAISPIFTFNTVSMLFVPQVFKLRT